MPSAKSKDKLINLNSTYICVKTKGKSQTKIYIYISDIAQLLKWGKVLTISILMANGGRPDLSLVFSMGISRHFYTSESRQKMANKEDDDIDEINENSESKQEYYKNCPTSCRVAKILSCYNDE